MAKGKDILTTGDVAKICRVAPRTASKWYDDGKLKGYRIPGSKDRRIPVDGLRQFMNQHDLPIRNLNMWLREHLNEEASKALKHAKIKARSHKHQYVEPEHVLWALLQAENKAIKILKHLDVDVKEILEKIHELFVEPAEEGLELEHLEHSDQLKRMIDFAHFLIDDLSHDIVGTEHLLLALLTEEECRVAQFLKRFGLDAERVSHVLIEAMEVVETL
jgi:hypothetical protein